jgi:uncharacterized protein YecE (DUF72 family)
MMNVKDNVHIGTSGWHYEHWKGPFYPKKMEESEFLDYYMKRLNTVEINNSFYNLPDAKTLRQWRDTVPKEFIFSVKASRYITHMKKLKDPKKSLSTLLRRLGSLGDKIGPILFQLPPRWKVNAGRLRSFLELLPDDNKYTFEFRDHSWFEEQVYEALSEHNAAFCIYELAGNISPLEVTADVIYIRLHGPGDAYEGSYPTRTLNKWAKHIFDWIEDGKAVYCYFDNDQAGYATKNALKLQEIVKK